MLEALLSGGNLFADEFVGLVDETRVGPVSVREDDRGHLTRNILRPVKIARHEEARRTFEVDLLDRVVPLVNLAVDHRIERRLRRHRPEALRNRQLALEKVTARLPFLNGFRRREGEGAVEVLERTKARIFGVGEVEQAECREGERGEAHMGNMSIVVSNGK